MKIDPYESHNIVFIDTEFSSLDPYVGELLSIGIVKMDGEELYIEFECDVSVCTEWVAKHVVPSLTQDKVSREVGKQQIVDFLGDTQPFAMAFVDNYDVIYITKLFGAGKLPFRWVTLDFASILFAMGVNPVKFLKSEKGAMAFYKKLGIDLKKYRQHHALDDAKLLREVWHKVTDREDEDLKQSGTADS